MFTCVIYVIISSIVQVCVLVPPQNDTVFILTSSVKIEFDEQNAYKATGVLAPVL